MRWLLWHSLIWIDQKFWMLYYFQFLRESNLFFSDFIAVTYYLLTWGGILGAKDTIIHNPHLCISGVPCSHGKSHFSSVKHRENLHLEMSPKKKQGSAVCEPKASYIKFVYKIHSKVYTTQGRRSSDLPPYQAITFKWIKIFLKVLIYVWCLH